MENLAGHGFVSVNIRPCLYIHVHYLFLVYDKGRISNENCAQTIFFFFFFFFFLKKKKKIAIEDFSSICGVFPSICGVSL